jgi:hypothetical protein
MGSSPGATVIATCTNRIQCKNGHVARGTYFKAVPGTHYAKCSFSPQQCTTRVGWAGGGKRRLARKRKLCVAQLQNEKDQHEM